jgi:hypothetical protein
VIERQVVGDDEWQRLGLLGAEFAVRPHPTSDRRSLSAPSAALFAASDRVDAVKAGQIEAVRDTLATIDADASYVDTWDGWVETVRQRAPSLLVLLSHTKDEQSQLALEVGAGDLCLVTQVDANYVSGNEDARPIVLLLGCETAVTDFGLQTFVSKFQTVGAALVVGTVASVLGQRAAAVAQTIATEFAATAKRTEPIAAGDLMLELRRKLLAAGELTALCLTAFGDADWELGGA